MNGFDQTAQRIAEQGREMLISRLRAAFEEAAAAHRDVIALDEQRLEEMVQRAVQRADGLQWRRALAMAAADELEIPLSEALTHPAVVRAQQLLGVPSYEEALAAVLSPEAVAAAQATAAAAAAPAEDLPDDADEVDPDEYGLEEFEPEEEDDVLDEDPREEALADEELEELGSGGEHEVAFTAVHLRGLEGFENSEPGVRIIFTELGVEIGREAEPEPAVALVWREVRSVELPRIRGPRRRRREGTRLVLETRRGQATFEIRDADADEIRSRLTPLHPVR